MKCPYCDGTQTFEAMSPPMMGYHVCCDCGWAFKASSQTTRSQR